MFGRDALPDRPPGVYVMLPLDTVSGDQLGEGSHTKDNRTAPSHQMCTPHSPTGTFSMNCFMEALRFISRLLQVSAEGVFRFGSTPWFSRCLSVLSMTGVEGVAVDVWVSAVTGVCPVPPFAFCGCFCSGLQTHMQCRRHQCGCASGTKG